MDFVSYIRNQSEKLNSREYVDTLWDELDNENETGETSVDVDAITDFNNHLPLVLEQFWETALEKLNLDVDEIDEDLKHYLLALIYHCTTHSQESGHSHASIMYASEVYIHLLTTALSEEIFNSKLYRLVLSTLQASIESNSCRQSSRRLLQKMKVFLGKSKLVTNDLEVTLATLLHVIFTKPGRVHDANFDTELVAESESLNAFLCLKVLQLKETVQARKLMVTLFLFNGLRKCSFIHLTLQTMSIIQANFRNLLRSLHEKFKEDNYKTFMNAFIHVWRHADFTYCGEAVLIMNNLEETHYRTLTDVLNKMTTSQPNKNLFRLSLAIVCNPPAYVNMEKVKVNNQILLRNILMNCLSPKNEICSAAIEAFGEILVSPDSQKESVAVPLRNLLSSSDSNLLRIPTVLRALKTLMNKKWTSKSRNKPLFGIVVSLMLISDQDYFEVYHEVLDLLGEEASPHDLKPFLPLLSEAYVKLNAGGHAGSATQILKIIFKMAVHPMASSSEFVKYLYSAMVCPTVCKGVIVRDSKIFINPIISNDFNFVEFFQKCHTLGLISKEHVARLMSKVPQMDTADLKLLCALIHLSDSQDLSTIADFVKSNFNTICNEPDLNHVLYIYDKTLKNSSGRSNSSLRSNEIMTCFLKKHLLEQNFRWNAVANAFSLLKSLHAHTNIEEDFGRLQTEYDNKLRLTLQSQGSFMPIFYYSQLVLFGKLLPNENNVSLMTSFLKLCSLDGYRKSQEFNPKIWIGCLLLHTNCCIIKNTMVEAGLEFLQKGLESNVTAVRLAAVNMTFDLCNMVTHNFEDLIKFMIRQLVLGDSVFKRTCLVKIDRLIRDDYLKLELEQFLIFAAILGDKNFGLGDYLNQLLNESFFISSTAVIAKYFVPFIVHINGYSKHPMYKISTSCGKAVHIMAKKISDRKKVYGLLFTPLPNKARFNIIYTLSANILEKMMKGSIKCDDGYWEMVKDSIHIFRLASNSSHDGDTAQAYHKKIMGQISKYLVQKSEYSEKRLYPEHSQEITYSTTTLLKLLFYNESNGVQKHIRILVFDALMHWTDFLLADLVHIIQVDRAKELHEYYIKIENMYKKSSKELRVSEESFENVNIDVNQPTTSGAVFNISNNHPEWHSSFDMEVDSE